MSKNQPECVTNQDGSKEWFLMMIDATRDINAKIHAILSITKVSTKISPVGSSIALIFSTLDKAKQHRVSVNKKTAWARSTNNNYNNYYESWDFSFASLKTGQFLDMIFWSDRLQTNALASKNPEVKLKVKELMITCDQAYQKALNSGKLQERAAKATKKRATKRFKKQALEAYNSGLCTDELVQLLQECNTESLLTG